MGVITARIVSRGSGGGGPSIPIPTPTVATFAALRTLSGDTDSLPAVFLTHRSQGGLFVWSTEAAADDGGTIANVGGFGSLSAGWRRNYSGPLDIKWFGASGDGSRGTVTINSGNASFTLSGLTTSDIGKPATFQGAGAAGTTLITTIVNVVGDVVTLAAAAATTSTNEFAWATDDTAAIQLAFAAAEGLDTSSRVLVVPRGIYGFTSTLAFPSGMRIQGQAGRSINTLIGASHLRLMASAATAFRKGNNCVGTHIEDLVLDGGRCAPIVLSNEYLSTDCSLERVTVIGALVNVGAQSGTLVDYPGTIEIDNERWRHCNVIQNPEDAGEYCYYAFRNLNSNAFDIHFEHGVVTNAYVLCYCSQGSINFRHNQLFRWVINCFRIGTKTQAMIIEDNYNEGDGAPFLEIAFTAGAQGSRPLILRDNELNGSTNIVTINTQPVWLYNNRAGDSFVYSNPDQANSGVSQTGSGPAVTIAGSTTASHEFLLKVTTGGARGTAKVDLSLDNGATWLLTGLTTAATLLLDTTGYTATFPVGTYVLDTTYGWTNYGIHPLVSLGTHSKGLLGAGVDTHTDRLCDIDLPDSANVRITRLRSLVEPFLGSPDTATLDADATIYPDQRSNLWVTTLTANRAWLLGGASYAGQQLFISRLGAADSFKLNVDGLITLDNGATGPSWAYLIYDQNFAWTLVASGGAAGTYLGTTVKTSGSSFTTGINTHTIRVTCVAGGGGGGGADTAAVSAAAGGGGSSGGYVQKTFVVAPSTAYSYAIGAAGTGGAGAGANNGTDGGDSTFTVGGTTITAKKGKGGIGEAAGATIGGVLGGAPPAISTSGDINGSGMPGGWSVRMTGLLGISGSGGSSIFGGGGNALDTAGTGNAGIGFGAGGGGALVLNGSSAATGGAGTAGVVIIEEFA